MPRRPRGELRGEIHHVLNRGNNRQTIFHDDRDHNTFLALVAQTKAAIPLRIYALTLIPNHFHAILQPNDVDTMSRFMHRLQQRYTTYHHQRYGTSGHLWQARYKGFPVQNDSHFLIVVRYVLRNAVRAGLVTKPRDHPWTTLAHPEFADEWPVERPNDFEAWLDRDLNADELTALRQSVNKSIPYGSAAWVTKTAAQLGIRLNRPNGRPPKPGTGALQSTQPPRTKGKSTD